MFKNFLSLFSLSVIIYILSFFHQLLISYFFGTSDLLDAYWLSLAVAFMFTIHAQPVKEILVNDYYTMDAQKKKISNKFLAQNLFFWLIVTLAGSLILLIWPKELIQLVAMEKLFDNFDQVTLMLRFFALFTILICMTEIL